MSSAVQTYTEGQTFTVNQAVHVGTWVNWSTRPPGKIKADRVGKGRVAGATLTITSSNGVLLTAFLTLFVTYTGSQLWAVICYGIHQWRSTPHSRDTLHHQQQVLLRLGLSDVGFVWRLLRTTWAWKRNQAPYVFRRHAPLISLAIVHCALIALAGLFIGQIAEHNAEVLVRSTICGWSNISTVQLAEEKLTALPGSDAFYITASIFYNNARQYTRNCYEQSGLLPELGCNIFMKPTLESTISTNDGCPFEDQMCEIPAMTLDTGFVDSNDDLGINSPPQNRIKYRKILSCAPMPAERDYSTPWTTNSTPPVFPWDAYGGGSDVMWKYYNLGPTTILGLERPTTFSTINSTASHGKVYTMLYVLRHFQEKLTFAAPSGPSSTTR